MFRRPKILQVIPITFELHILPKNDGYILLWGESQNKISEVYIKDEFIKLILDYTTAYSRYQDEFFSKSCSHHKWIWYYEEFIPAFMHNSANSNIKNKRPHSLNVDHINGLLMEAYIDKELKTKENEYTSTSQFSFIVLTWNAAGMAPSGDLMSWIGCSSKKFTEKANSPDFIVIGLQEICGLSKLLGDLNRVNEWTLYLKQQIWSTFQEEYVMMHSASLVGLMNLLFAKKCVVRNVSQLSCQQIKLGLKGFAGNKGALCFRFEVFTTSVCFINVHLPPHKQNFKLRNENIQDINRNIKFQLPENSVSVSEHENIIWFGDLNYRIDALTTEKIVKFISKNDLKKCLQFDQLCTARKFNMVLQDFKEGEITFLPTFKYLIGSNQHNYKRDPAWCDRILYKGNIDLLRYDSCDSIQLSDHKPVFSEFIMNVKHKDKVKMNEVLNTIHNEIKELHYKSIPKVLVSCDTLEFNTVHFNIPSTKTFEITNVGNSKLSFVIEEPDWVQTSLKNYTLLSQESIELSTTIIVSVSVLKCERSSAAIQKYLKIKINEKCEIIVKIQFNLFETFVGLSCQELCKKYPSRLSSHLNAPLVSLVQFLQKHNFGLADLSSKKTEKIMIGEIVKSIDEGQGIPEKFSVNDVVSVLCFFVRNLACPLLDKKIVDGKFNMVNFVGIKAIKYQVLEDIGKEKKNFLRYLIEYVRSVMKKENGNCANLLAVKMYRSIYQEEYGNGRVEKHRILILESMLED